MILVTEDGEEVSQVLGNGKCRPKEGAIYRWEIEESHLSAPNTKCIYEGPLKDGKSGLRRD